MSCDPLTEANLGLSTDSTALLTGICVKFQHFVCFTPSYHRQGMCGLMEIWTPATPCGTSSARSSMVRQRL